VILWIFARNAEARLFIQRDASCAPAADGAHAIAVIAQERRALMYNPKLSGKSVATLFRLKRALKKPMTELIEEMVQQSLKAVDKGVVCDVCISEKNNECKECYLSERS